MRRCYLILTEKKHIFNQSVTGDGSPLQIIEVVRVLHILGCDHNSRVSGGDCLQYITSQVRGKTSVLSINGFMVEMFPGLKYNM